MFKIVRIWNYACFDDIVFVVFPNFRENYNPIDIFNALNQDSLMAIS